MNPDSSSLSNRALELWEWVAKWITASIIVIGTMKKGYLPIREHFIKKRREAMATEMRLVLKEELHQLNSVCENLTVSTERFVAISTDMIAIELWVERMMFMIKDNHERLNEMNDLLTEAGFGSKDRRHQPDRRLHDPIVLPPLGEERRKLDG